MHWFYYSGIFVLIFQVAGAIHVFRTGRPLWWILVIFFFNWIGLLVYALIELLPEWRGDTRVGRSVPFGSAMGSGQASIRSLQRMVDESPTVANRTRLAGAILRKGDSARAVQIYESCLEGFYAEDKNLWYELAEAYHANRQPAEALAYLKKLEGAGFHDYRDRRDLLMALTLERLGRLEEALSRLEHLVSTFPGQEANFNYARLLIAHGDIEKGRIVVEGMLDRRRFHDSRYCRREAQWYSAAKKLLK